MKNRLQFNRLFKRYESKEAAMTAFSARTFDANFKPLIGEPITFRYNDEDGLHLVLAIGKATGTSVNDTDYEFIDIHGVYKSLDELAEQLSGITGDVIGALSASVVTNKYDISILSGALEDHELVAAAAFNDLNSRILDLSGSTGGDLAGLSGSVVYNRTLITNLSGVVETLSGAVIDNQNNITVLSGVAETLSGAVADNQSNITILSGIIENDEFVTSAALNDLNGRIINLSATTRGMYNDLLDKIDNLSGGGASLEDLQALSGAVQSFSGATNSKFTSLSSATVHIQDSLADFFDDAEYVSSAKTIVFKNGGDIKATIDATDFIKDGMVSDVYIGIPTGGTETCLIITFNTDAGHQDIAIPVSEIFDPRTLDELTEKLNELSGTVENNELVIAAALNDLNSRIIDLSGSSVDLSNYYTKDETYNKQEVNDLIEESGQFNPDLYYDKTAINEGVSASTRALSAATIALSAATTAISQNLTNLSAATTGISQNLGNLSGATEVIKTGLTNLSAVTLTGVSMNGSEVAITDHVAILGTVLTGFNETQLSSAVTGTGNVFSSIQVSGHEITMGKDISAATVEQLQALSGALETLSASTVEALTDITSAMDLNELVIAAAFNDLNSRVLELESALSLAQSRIATLESDQWFLTKLQNLLSAGTKIKISEVDGKLEIAYDDFS